MSVARVPALRQRFPDGMRIKGLLPKMQTMLNRVVARVPALSSFIERTSFIRGHEAARSALAIDPGNDRPG